MGWFSASSPSISPTQQEVPPTFTGKGKEYVFIILITHVVVLLVLLVVAIRKIRESLRRTGNPNPASSVTTAAATRRNPIAMPAEQGSCAICLEELVGKEKVRRLPQCGHMYHRACINRWLTVGSEVCPICRRSVTVRKAPD